MARPVINNIYHRYPQIQTMNRTNQRPIVVMHQANQKEIITSADGRQFEIEYQNGHREQALQQASRMYGYQPPQIPRVTVTAVPTYPTITERERKYSFMPEAEPTSAPGRETRYGFMDFPSVADRQSKFSFMTDPVVAERQRKFGVMSPFMDRYMPGRSIADTVGYRFNFMNEGVDHNKFGMQ